MSKRIQGTLEDSGLSTTYLKLEPIKEEITWTGGMTLEDDDITPTPTTDGGITYTWTFGSPALASVSTGVILQFVEYDPATKCETPLWHGTPTISSTVEMTIDYFGEEERTFGKTMLKTRRLAKYLKALQDDPYRPRNKPYLKLYILPENYVTKQIQIGTIQGYWQDPTFSNVMWIQHTSCCSFTTGPFSPTVTTGPPDTITQTALASKATTGTEVFHNIIPLLDTIMTYAN